MRHMPHTGPYASIALAALLLALANSAASQAQPAAQPNSGGEVEAGLALEDAERASEPDDARDPDPSGLILLGGKIGGIAPFNGLDLFVHGGIELGYVFPALDQGLGVLLQVEYSAPQTTGEVDEELEPERVPSGTYDWKLLQKELVLQPTFLYRMTSLSDSITPYAGLGLRVYLLESTVSGKADDQAFGETRERSTHWGVGVPLGAEFALGPGGLTAELLFQWGPFEHTLTGDTHLGALSLFVGYRLLL